MSDIALQVEGLGKRYRIGSEQNAGMYRYKSLRDSLSRLSKRPWQAAKSMLSSEPVDESNTFWALKDINFDVKRGEVIGIIGRNGAGKSTLLKILSRITKPTTGCVELYGRVGSLLEVGTGFHPELTGRENIYVNAAILGMTRAEVKSKFDEIIAFSETEKFLDTPVKQYSSGMYMRLAFAVAAHLEPEILVVDEVLAVGDAAFQKKCLGKMKDVANQGRTVLFVSHNTSAVQYLCDRAVLLQAGRVAEIGEVSEVLAKYLDTMGRGSRSAPTAQRLGPDIALGEIAFDPPMVKSGGPSSVSVTLEALADTTVSHLCLLIHASSAIRVAILDLRSGSGAYEMRQGSKLCVEADIASVDMVEGEYDVGLFVDSSKTNGFYYGLASLFVAPGDQDSSRPMPYEPHSRGYLELRASAATAHAV